MAKCAECGKRKAKRDCPALGKGICSLCCGRLREKQIHCPSHCDHLKANTSYQAQRIMEKKESSLAPHLGRRRDPLRDERLAWLAYHIEHPINEHGEHDPELSDKEVLLALEYARKTVEKGQSLIFLPDDPIKPQNTLGERILANMNSCRFERGIILSAQQDLYSREEKQICLERVILTIKQTASNLEKRSYLDQLNSRLSRIETMSDSNRLIRA